MDINELKQIRDDVFTSYEEEKNKFDDDVLNDELYFIKKEINKLDELISIYNNDDIEYRVMKLEILYMRNLYDMDEDEFNSLSVDEETDIFMKLFPNKWSYSIPIEDKLKYLEEAIIDNKPISIEGKVNYN